MERLLKAKAQKIFLTILIALFIFAVSSQPLYSQGILPKATIECDVSNNASLKNALENKEEFYAALEPPSLGLGNLLGCALRTGKIKLFMIPFFITYIVQFLLSIAGLIAVLFVVYGGFRYATGGLTEDKESGKKIIQHALLGLVVALSAWIVVNFIQIALTS